MLGGEGSLPSGPGSRAAGLGGAQAVVGTFLLAPMVSSPRACTVPIPLAPRLALPGSLWVEGPRDSF